MEGNIVTMRLRRYRLRIKMVEKISASHIERGFPGWGNGIEKSDIGREESTFKNLNWDRLKKNHALN